jgi:hypothetical protein
VPKKIHRRRDAAPRDGVEKHGEPTFADPVNKKYPIDTPGRIKAAWAYIHQSSNAEKYTFLYPVSSSLELTTRAQSTYSRPSDSAPRLVRVTFRVYR